jgi:hypothetical protein
MLALTLFSTTSAVIMAIGMIVPLVKLLILLSVNGKATKVLREHGVKVGLMGAKLDQIPAPGTVSFR